MKLKLFFISLVLSCFTHGFAAGQSTIGLSFAYNHVFFKNDLNKPKHSLPKICFDCPGKPGFSLKFHYNRFAIEGYTNYQYLFYNGDINLSRDLRTDSLISTRTTHIGFALHYAIFEKKYISVSAMLGYQQSNYSQRYVKSIWPHPNGWTESFDGSDSEKVNGIMCGMNISAPINKFDFATLNGRYAHYPNGVFFRNGILFELGIGVRFNKELKDL